MTASMAVWQVQQSFKLMGYFIWSSVCMQATRAGLHDWPQPEHDSASATQSTGREGITEQNGSRKHRQKRISATEEIVVKQEETAMEVRRWTRRTRWDGSLTPIKERVYRKAEWARGLK